MRSVLWGILLYIIFTVASAYPGLKVGQHMESAIPILVLTIGASISAALDHPGELIVTGMGGVAGSLVARAIHATGTFYPGARPARRTDDIHLPDGRRSWRALSDSA